MRQFLRIHLNHDSLQTEPFCGSALVSIIIALASSIERGGQRTCNSGLPVIFNRQLPILGYSRRIQSVTDVILVLV